MPKLTSIYTRIEPNIKEKAEEVFKTLGIPMSSAISLFLRQVVLQKGIPFSIKLPENYPLDFQKLSKSEFDIEILSEFDDLNNKNVISSKKFVKICKGCMKKNDEI